MTMQPRYTKHRKSVSTRMAQQLVERALPVTTSRPMINRLRNGGVTRNRIDNIETNMGSKTAMESRQEQEVARMIALLSKENVRVSLILKQGYYIVRIWNGNTGLSVGCDNRALCAALRGALDRFTRGDGFHDPQLRLAICPQCGFVKT